MATLRSSNVAVRSKDAVASPVQRGGQLLVIESSDLGALDRGAWGELVASAPDGTVFQSIDWLIAWWDCFGSSCRPLLLLAYRGRELVGAAPLLIDDASDRPCIRFIGEKHADYLTFPARDGAAEVVEDLLEHLERGYGTRYDLRLIDVPDTSPLGSLLQRWQKRIPLRLLLTGVTSCPRLKIRDNDGQLRKVLNKKSLKRHAAKLGAQGAVEVQHFSDAQEIVGRLEQFFEQHRRRWAVTPFASLFQTEADCRFYYKLVQSGLCDGGLIFTTVCIGGQVVACHFGLISRADFIWYKPSFDVTLSRFSPGEVLLRELILLAAERDFEYFDFTRGDEAFKSRFSSEVRYNSSYLICAKRVDALAARAGALARALAQANLSQTSSTGWFLRHLKWTYVAAREQAGAGLPRAVLASLCVAGGTWGRWLMSRRTVHLFSAQVSPPIDTKQGGQVREADLEYLLGGSNRLAELLAYKKHLLADVHKRLARGERCFVAEEQNRAIAIGWATPRSPHPLAGMKAALHFPRRALMLHDLHVLQNVPAPGAYCRLLVGIRSALGAVPTLMCAEDSNVALLEGIRHAGFTLEAAIEDRTLFGRRQLTSRVFRPQAISWEILRREVQTSPATRRQEAG